MAHTVTYQHHILNALDKGDATIVPKTFPRATLVSICVIQDAINPKRGVAASEVRKAMEKQQTDDIVIGKFWKDSRNKDVVDAFMNNKLCRDAAKGDKAALAAFKNWAVQDYFYLIDWVKFRALRFATVPIPDDLNLDALDTELTSISHSTGYARDWFKDCVTHLGILESDFRVERTIAEVAYGQFLQNYARSDNWYSLHIILIGCYWAWCKLALELYNDPTTDKNTVFYEYWIKPNLDLTDPQKPQLPESANNLSIFLDQNAQIWSSGIGQEQGQSLFRSSLRLEVGLFNSGYETPTKKPA